MKNLFEIDYPFLDEEGNESNLHVEIGKPQKHFVSGYECSYSLKAPHLDINCPQYPKMHGADSLQAFWHALQVVRFFVSKYEREHQVKCETFCLKDLPENI